MGKSIDIASLSAQGELAIDTPNPFEGEIEAEEAIGLLSAIKLANHAAESIEGQAALQKLLDDLLPAVIGRVETARNALSGCRALLETGHE